VQVQVRSLGACCLQGSAGRVAAAQQGWLGKGAGGGREKKEREHQRPHRRVLGRYSSGKLAQKGGACGGTGKYQAGQKGMAAQAAGCNAKAHGGLVGRGMAGGEGSSKKGPCPCLAGGAIKRNDCGLGRKKGREKGVGLDEGTTQQWCNKGRGTSEAARRASEGLHVSRRRKR